MTNKKNNIIIIISIILLITLIIFLLINNKGNNNNKGDLTEITYEQLQEKIDSKEDFIIVLSQTTCSHCASYKPIVKQVAKKYNLNNVYYLDYDKYDEDEIKKILKELKFDGGTPTTFFFKKGKEISVLNRISGSVSEEKLISSLKKLEYIEK